MFLHTESLSFGNMAEVPAVTGHETDNEKSGLFQSDILDSFFSF